MHQTEQEREKPPFVSRREALKALAAATGTVAITSLPSYWEKPLIEAGALPAFAQASPRFELPPLACIECGQGTGIDVILVQDRSGSISIQQEIVQQDLNNSKEALKLFIDGLDLSKDQVGLVSFNEEANLNQILTQDSNAIKAAIDAIPFGGGTDIALAIQVADAELASPRRNPANQAVMIVVTDGYSFTDPIPDANTAKSKGIRILTVAFGNSVDYDTLRDMASSPDDFYFTPTSIDLITIFDPNCNL